METTPTPETTTETTPSILTDEQTRAILDELRLSRAAWRDLPRYVYTDEYQAALMAWIEKTVAAGALETHSVRSLVTWALDHETGGKRPYFDFDRQSA